MSPRLIHDVAWATSQHILEVFAPLLREEEQRDAFVEIYARVKAGMECLAIQADRMQRRIKPSNN
jgi:hypothetical protein